MPNQRGEHEDSAIERPALAVCGDESPVWSGDQVFDPVRRRWVRLSPEEWVRQHVLLWLSDRLGVPLGLVQVEQTIRVGGQARRPDILVRDRNGDPWMVVECKAPTVSIGQATADQVGWYNTVLRAAHVLMTNGQTVAGWGRDANGNFRFLTELPYFPTIQQ